MSLDEDAINAVKEYFDAVSQNAVNVVHEAVGRDTTFAEFMEAVSYKINQLSAELVASEVLSMSAGRIENFNGGEGMDVNDVQELIESNSVMDFDEDEDE